MNEYDLFKSIGEVDEKLMKRYDAETAREVRKSARRVRLIVDIVVLLLLFAAVVALFLHPTKKKIRMPSGSYFGAKAAYAAVGFSADAPAAQAVETGPGAWPAAPAGTSAVNPAANAQDQLTRPTLSELLAQSAEHPIRAAEGKELLEIWDWPDALPDCFEDSGVKLFHGSITQKLSVWDLFNDAELQQAAAFACRGGGVRTEAEIARLAWTLKDYLPKCEELKDLDGSPEIEWFPASAILYSSQVWRIEYYPAELEAKLQSIMEPVRKGEMGWFYDGVLAYVFVSAVDGHVIAIHNCDWRFLPGIVRGGAEPGM